MTITDTPVVPHKAIDFATAIAELAFPVTATYPEQPKPEEFLDLDIVKAFLYAITSGTPFRFLGDPGTGKTAFVLWMAEEFGIEVVYLPAAVLSPEDLAVPLPHRLKNDDGSDGVMVLDFLVYNALMSPNPKIIVIDEMMRATTQVRNELLELSQQGRIADIVIPNLVTVLCMDNEGAENGITTEADFAMVDRWATVKVDPNKTPWRRALAAVFANVDLSGVFKIYARLTPRLRYLLSPRTLEHVLWNLLNGNPGIWGIGINVHGRCLLVDENGNDKTVEVLNDIAAALGVQNRTTVADQLERALTSAISGRKNLFIEGPPGCGKTAFIREQAKLSGADVLILSAPVISPDNLTIPFPVDGKLEIMVMEWLARKGDKILVLDEIWRCSTATRNKLMEILQQRTIGGQDIPDLLCVIGINNPKEVAGFKLDVGKADRAQVDRFFLSVSIQPNDVPAKTWLRATYGEEAEPFIEWLEDDVDELGRAFITMRGIERLIGLARHGLPLEWAKPYMKGEYAAVSLHELEARLSKRPLARLRQIAANVEQYEAQMGGTDGDNTPAQAEVLIAFSRADLDQLEVHREVCVRLFRHLSQQNLISLLRPAGKRQGFWQQILREARGHAPAKK